jgi:hypothetical protein
MIEVFLADLQAIAARDCNGFTQHQRIPQNKGVLHRDLAVGRDGRGGAAAVIERLLEGSDGINPAERLALHGRKELSLVMLPPCCWLASAAKQREIRCRPQERRALLWRHQ